VLEQGDPRVALAPRESGQVIVELVGPDLAGDEKETRAVAHEIGEPGDLGRGAQGRAADPRRAQQVEDVSFALRERRPRSLLARLTDHDVEDCLERAAIPGGRAHGDIEQEVEDSGSVEHERAERQRLRERRDRVPRLPHRGIRDVGSGEESRDVAFRGGEEQPAGGDSVHAHDAIGAGE
jgi:hypothetical protein